MILTEDHIRQLPDWKVRELIRGEHARAEFDVFAQRQIQESLSADGPQRHVDGLGRKVMTIHHGLAWRLRLKYGAGCLSDADFRRRLLQDNPFLRVQSSAAKLTLRVDGRRDAIQSKREGTTAGEAPRGDTAGPHGLVREDVGGVCSRPRSSSLALATQPA